jgi:hypothetical protein
MDLESLQAVPVIKSSYFLEREFFHDLRIVKYE